MIQIDEICEHMQIFLLSKKPKEIPSTHEYSTIDFEDFGKLLVLVKKPIVSFAKYQTALDKLYGVFAVVGDVDEVLVIGPSDVVLVIESFNKVFKIATQFFITEEEIKENIVFGIIQPKDNPEKLI